MEKLTLRKQEQGTLDFRQPSDWRSVLCWSLLPVLALVAGLGLVAGKGIAAAAYPTDNSFTAEAAFAKERAHYPDISIARVAPGPGIVVERGRVYRQIGARSLHLDLFRPDVTGEASFNVGQHPGRPAVLLVHGGGWRSGNRTLQEPMAIYLANRGFVAATVEYRLSLEAQYPAAVQDIKAALCWLHRNAGQLGVDRHRIAILGASAGAQLATLVGVTPGIPAYREEGEGRDTACEAVAAIVNLDGVVSFITPMALAHENDPRKNPSAAGAWFGGRYEEVPERWREASPLEYAGAGSPPTLFINSSRPRFHAGRDEYIARLTAADVATEVMTHGDSPHPFWLFQPWFDPTAERVADFLQRVVK
ncbi:alpha/beta hydrolase fold domain-containing protein [Microbulbifer sp. SH-1]|uniref:alpha/beta hydrolase n=1 Tax=Microbulbifer sp. SH-1 TaxID=2681547 RepID=UPI00140D5311|nr:alpha/beta hydrolase [Microbulbifer sp. SH-1]QIL89618.1 alpha/beta hydrolase fold domain-containing protein [Microbulbifer sp. SH-1]